MTHPAGATRYVAFPDSVERVTVVCAGTDRHHKRRLVEPITVRTCTPHCTDPRCGDDHTYAVPAAKLLSDPLVAAIRSAELGSEVR